MQSWECGTGFGGKSHALEMMSYQAAQFLPCHRPRVYRQQCHATQWICEQPSRTRTPAFALLQQQPPHLSNFPTRILGVSAASAACAGVVGPCLVVSMVYDTLAISAKPAHDCNKKCRDILYHNLADLLTWLHNSARICAQVVYMLRWLAYVSMRACRVHAFDDARHALFSSFEALQILTTSFRAVRSCPHSAIGLQQVMEAALTNLRDASLVLGHTSDAEKLTTFRDELR